MRPISLCTFNANNLYARYRFTNRYPGDRTGKSLAPERWGYLPDARASFVEVFNDKQRRLAASVLTNDGLKFPDVICLQEVESLAALRAFNEKYLFDEYPYALLIDSRDFRQIDVAVLSKVEIASVRSHIDDRDPAPRSRRQPWLFSRDCLEVNLSLNRSGSQTLALFINHLKSKYAESVTSAARGDELRKRQADAVGRIVRQRYKGRSFDRSLFAVVGDLNDEPSSAPLRALIENTGLTDALKALPRTERWTHYYQSGNSRCQLDYMLQSPALARVASPPRIDRRALKSAAGKEYASDHCPVTIDIGV